MESNISLLRANNVSLVRRRSGGGAVYHVSTSVCNDMQDFIYMYM